VHFSLVFSPKISQAKALVRFSRCIAHPPRRMRFSRYGKNRDLSSGVGSRQASRFPQIEYLVEAIVR
jgi:hypothetical protein